MAIKVALNGFGRIGRSVARLLEAHPDFELVAINDIASSEMMAYLLAYDSVHGAWEHNIDIHENFWIVDGHTIAISSYKNPEEIDFGRVGADVVIECSGLFLTTPLVSHHLNKGVKRVIISAPAVDETPTFVLGVNAHLYKGEKIFSNASCTTNCLGPIAKILDTHLGITKGLMTTVHSYTNDQNLLDVKHMSQKRRSRAAAVNIIPTTTGAAKAMGKVLPTLEGKLHGQSVRVPVPDVSMVDLTVNVARATTIDEVNGLLRHASENELHGILGIDVDYRVSQDFVNDPRSGIVALDLTQVIGDDMVKVMAWYDNEWGYANRLLDMMKLTFKEGE